jgi:hypothetical protein
VRVTGLAAGLHAVQHVIGFGNTTSRAIAAGIAAVGSPLR